VIGLAVAPAELETRIAARARWMVETGLVDEVRALRARGLADSAAAWASVGYREIRAHVDGACDLEPALAALVLATRRFAKRQRTWFRAEPGIVWRRPDDACLVRAEVGAFFTSGARPAP
jgi:tRNA dimethylallyltransferase